MKNLLKFTFLFIITLGMVSCGDDDDGVTPPGDATTTISDFVATNAEYSSLAAALEVAGLTTTLDGTDDFTVFAPDNDAFAAFLTENGFASLDDVPIPALRNILLNHVVSGKNESSSLTTGYINSLATFGTTERNLSLYLDLTSGVRINGVSSVTTADVGVSNGVIHAVDTVIGIPTIVTQATANPAFSTLVDALVAATDGSTDYVALLSGTTSSPFTVFAPTNDAFAGLLSGLGLSGLNDVPQPLLQTILNYHVLAGVNVQSGDLTDGQTATTFQGEDITIDLTNGPQIIDASGMATNIIVPDVQTGNGVVHALDRVLLPQAAIDVVDPTIKGLAMITPDLSILFEALEITGLDSAVDDRTTELTVFAPTNESFEAFLTSAGLASINDVPVDLLTQTLLNHVLTGTNLSSSFSTSYTNTLATFNGEADAALSLYVNTDSGVTLNGVSDVVTPDVLAANGVVHVVNAVIALPTVVTFATADAGFSSLVAALTRADQPDYVTTLSTGNGTSPAPFTVLAPTNEAFEDLLVELGLMGLDDIPGPVLTAALNTHVIAGANVRAEDLVDGPVMTLGDDVIIDATNATVTDQNGRVSQIIVTNVQAANGVVHAINKVLLPN
ncbi:MAG: fasciclin domain-containing protein [Patiriisocius sp.]|uniref:fasciclin domain-containing protein n=1 Tax=Patiriisocius sp. TaxID=2822396 RepID=UPI003EF1C983